MKSLEYRATGIGEIELIRPLWNRLNEHHRERAGIFRHHYERMTFEDRKAYFERLAGTGTLMVDVATDPESGRCIGYCVSSLSRERTGEIESIFVEEDYRNQGAGSALMDRALAWLGTCGSVRNRVSVGDGNEAAFGFYRRFGFYPRMTVLEKLE
jgi:ribosomal protein S18 acetylase RimI-like enzyme